MHIKYNYRTVPVRGVGHLYLTSYHRCLHGFIVKFPETSESRLWKKWVETNVLRTSCGSQSLDPWVGEGAKPYGITPAPGASLRFQKAISHFLFPGNIPVFFIISKTEPFLGEVFYWDTVLSRGALRVTPGIESVTKMGSHVLLGGRPCTLRVLTSSVGLRPRWG